MQPTEQNVTAQYMKTKPAGMGWESTSAEWMSERNDGMAGRASGTGEIVGQGERQRPKYSESHGGERS